jgi:hypothetical protein
MASVCIETINKLGVVDLRSELEKRSLSGSGRKDLLIERLKMSLLKDENTNKSSKLADHREATELDKTTKASIQSNRASLSVGKNYLLKIRMNQASLPACLPTMEKPTS